MMNEKKTIAVLLIGVLIGICIRPGVQPAVAGTDAYRQFPSGLKPTGPAEHIDDVTPAATALTNVCRAVYVGTGGDITVTTSGGSTTTIPGVPSGSLLPASVTMINTTGTTASDIQCWW